MLTREQLEIRRTGIGGSDIAAICGLSKYKTPVQIYLEKIGEEIPQQETNDFIYFGNALEDDVAQAYADKNNVTISIEPNTLRHPKYPWMLANIDRWVNDKEYILECKTASVYKSNEFGPDGSDYVPENYLLQLAWYSAVCNVNRVDLAVLIGGHDFRTYTYNKNIELENKLIKIAYNFWHNNVLKKEMPTNIFSEDTKILYPEAEEKYIIADDNIRKDIIELNELKRKSKEISDNISQLQASIQVQMRDCSYIKDENGNNIITWKNANSKGSFDIDSFKKDYPDLYNKYMKPGKKYRIFKIRENL